MKKKLKVGIVGCGRIANQNHLPVWRKINDIEVVAVCDVNEKAAIETSRRFRIKRYHTDFSSMLEKEELDIVDNCTIVTEHTPLSIQAMEARCHTIVEKPIALTEVDANKMIRIAKKNNVHLFPVHNTLFNPVMMDALTAIAKAGIGEIVGVDASYLKRRDDDWIIDKNHWSHGLPMGMFSEVLAHPIYIELAILGRLECVSVSTKKFLPFRWIKADELRVTLDGEKGIGRIMISLNSPKNAALIDIYGTRAILNLDLWSLTMIKHKSIKYSPISIGIDSLSQSLQKLKGVIGAFSKTVSGRAVPGHWILIPNFVDVIKNNADPLVTAEDGKEVARILEAITNDFLKL